VRFRPVRVPRIRGRLLLLLGAVALIGSSACSSGSQPGSSPAVTVSGAWVRITGGLDQPAAGYLTIDNHGSADDALLSASSPRAGSVELHETMPEMSGMIGMDSVTRVSCPAGGSVAFAPGGYHLMISGLSGQLKAGDLLELDLVFEHAGTIVVQAEVRQT